MPPCCERPAKRSAGSVDRKKWTVDSRQGPRRARVPCPLFLVYFFFPVLLKLFLLFVVLPLVELTLLLLLADATDWWVALLLVIATGLLGAWLSQRQGWRTWVRIRQELVQGRMPADALFDGVLILIAGILLLTPGLLSDLVGISLLVPVCRRFYKARLTEWFKRKYLPPGMGGKAAASNDQPARVIESYVVEKEE